MGNCKDCKHWETVDMRNKQWKECSQVDWVVKESKIPDDGFAIYTEANDDYGLQTGLKTGPMFGCVKFEPK